MVYRYPLQRTLIIPSIWFDKIQNAKCRWSDSHSSKCPKIAKYLVLGVLYHTMRTLLSRVSTTRPGFAQWSASSSAKPCVLAPAQRCGSGSGDDGHTRFPELDSSALNGVSSVPSYWPRELQRLATLEQCFPATARLLGNPAACLRTATSSMLTRGCHWLTRPQITPRCLSMLGGSLCFVVALPLALLQAGRTSCTPSSHPHWSVEAGNAAQMDRPLELWGRGGIWWPCKL
ncbi:hypothetical protein F5Y12DRAFT_284831 [Xylaria sp. FL1777]|nr:hypothetical protein F5Y12DRAFT_284831 [Xylaria sp. FL1777]